MLFNEIMAIMINWVTSRKPTASGKVNLRVIGGASSMIQSIMAINNTDIAIIISKIAVRGEGASFSATINFRRYSRRRI